MTSGGIEVCALTRAELLDSPVERDWVLEGDPQARSNWWSASSDGVDQNYVWECTAGRFRWYFDRDETVHIISGEVRISGDGVPETWLRAGDAALFRAGTWAVWFVPSYVLKHAVLRNELPGPLRLQLSYGRRVKRLLRRALGRPATVADPQPALSAPA